MSTRTDDRRLHPQARTLRRARSVEWERVASSNVHSALYDASTGDFYVRFKRGGPDDIYVYPNRSAAEWDDFRTALSKGAWIWEHPRAEGWPFDLLTARDFAGIARDEVPRATRRFLE